MWWLVLVSWMWRFWRTLKCGRLSSLIFRVGGSLESPAVFILFLDCVVSWSLSIKDVDDSMMLSVNWFRFIAVTVSGFLYKRKGYRCLWWIQA